jgi:hypothetical protein
MPSATANALLTVTVLSIGAPVSVNVDAYATNSTVKSHASYQGLVAASRDASSLQLGTRVSVSGVQKASDGSFSQLFVANPGAAPATVAIQFTSTDGSTYSKALPVPAGAGASYGVYDDDLLPVGFRGSAVLTSDQPIATVVFIAKMTRPASFAYDDVYSAAPGIADQVSAVANPLFQSAADSGVAGVSRTVVTYAALALGMTILLMGLARRDFVLRRRRGETIALSTLLERAPVRPHVLSSEPAASLPSGESSQPWGRMVVVQGNGIGSTFVLTRDTELVGRGRFCSVRLKDRDVANAHCLVNREGWVHASTPGCTVEVDGSTARVRPIANGSIIRVGRTCLRFETT